MKALLLSEEEVNRDLRRCFPGQGLRVEDLVDRNDPFLAPTLEDALAEYTIGRKIGDSCLKEKVIRLRAHELSGIASVVYSFLHLSELVGRDRAAQGLDDLRRMRIIEFDRMGKNRVRVVHYLMDFDGLMNGLREYLDSFGKEAYEIEVIVEGIRRDLSPYRKLINEVARISRSIYEKFKWDLKEEEELRKENEIKRKVDPYRFLKRWANGPRPSIFEIEALALRRTLL